MLVDDEPFNIMTLKTHLSKSSPEYQFTILDASNGDDALILFEHFNRRGSVNPISVIIMDVLMPEHNGIEVSKTIKQMIKK